jgi:soluble lytic murein transglycosylase-like protein
VGFGRALGNTARRRLLAVAAGLAAADAGAPARAEIALLASGQTLKLDAHREEAGLLVLVLRGGGEVHLPPNAVRGFVPDEVIEELGRAGSGGDVRALVEQAARRRGLDPALVLAVVSVESGFRPEAVSPKGAQGLMQLMPRTAAALGVEDAFDPEQNLDAGVRHLESLLKLYDGNLTRALAAYNAGQGAVARHGGVPPYRETREYVRRVLERYRAKQAK